MFPVVILGINWCSEIKDSGQFECLYYDFFYTRPCKIWAAYRGHTHSIVKFLREWCWRKMTFNLSHVSGLSCHLATEMRTINIFLCPTLATWCPYSFVWCLRPSGRNLGTFRSLVISEG